jgi:hypothetical protein
MSWDHIGELWERLKREIDVRWRVRTGDLDQREAAIGASASQDVERKNSQTTIHRTPNTDHRCDFSQHIGC